MTTSTETEASVKKTPSFLVYQAIERDNHKTFYNRIGVTWAHRKGGGHSLDLNCIPLSGHMVLFVPSAKPE